MHSLEGHDDYMAGVAFSPNDITLAAAGHDGKAILWDVGVCERPQELRRWAPVPLAAYGQQGPPGFPQQDRWAFVEVL